jgi:hypothetical protein
MKSPRITSLLKTNTNKNAITYMTDNKQTQHI